MWWWGLLRSDGRAVVGALRAHHRPMADAHQAIRAVDLLEHNVLASRDLVTKTLVSDGWDERDAEAFATVTVSQDDYLLRPHEPQSVDFVLGNPPYIRLEDIPANRAVKYRTTWPTMGGRADIYVGFIECGLESLRQDGVLGFIVADRWMHNAYGAEGPPLHHGAIQCRCHGQDAQR